MRTTLILDDDVAAKINAEMRRSGKTLEETVNETLRMGLSMQKELRSADPFKVHARKMGTYPGLNYDNISELLDDLSL